MINVYANVKPHPVIKLIRYLQLNKHPSYILKIRTTIIPLLSNKNLKCLLGDPALQNRNYYNNVATFASVGAIERCN